MEDYIQIGKDAPLVLIRSRTPLYVFPAVLAILLVCAHVGLLHKKSLGQDTVKARVAAVEDKLDRTADRTHLLGILHNENFATLVNRDRDVIYIQRDWTIKEMPHRLSMNSRMRELIREKFLTKPTPSPFKDFKPVKRLVTEGLPPLAQLLDGRPIRNLLSRLF